LKSGSCSVEEDLKRWLADAETVVIAGIGNPIRGDDFVGVAVIQALQGKVPENVHLIECETVPEGYLQTITDLNPTHVLLVDAGLLNLNPGEACLLQPQQLSEYRTASTHMLPLRIFCDYLSATTVSRIALLLVQPKNVEFSEGLSPEVQKSAGELADLLLRLLTYSPA